MFKNPMQKKLNTIIFSLCFFFSLVYSENEMFIVLLFGQMPQWLLLLFFINKTQLLPVLNVYMVHLRITLFNIAT